MPSLHQDFRRKVKSKIQRCLLFFEKDENVNRCVLACVLAEPVDFLWRRLQVLDDGNALKDICNPHRNPFAHALVELGKLLSHDLDRGPLQPFYVHFLAGGDASIRGKQYAAILRKIGFSMVAQIVWRFLKVYGEYPFRLFQAVDVTLSDIEKTRALEGLFSSRDCCLDAQFSRKIKAKTKTSAAMQQDTNLFKALHQCVHTVKVCNMHIERELAYAKKSCSVRTPLLERFCSTAFLGRLLWRHTAAQGKDPRSGVQRSALRKHTPKPKAKRLNRVSGLYTYLSRHLPRGLSSEARRLEKMRLSNIFANLPKAQRLLYKGQEIQNMKRKQAREENTVERQEKERRYACNLGLDLWNLSDWSNPFSPEAAAQSFGTLLGQPWTSLRSAIHLRNRLATQVVTDAGKVANFTSPIVKLLKTL
eukprot:758474-Amphidinium_carterae.1